MASTCRLSASQAREMDSRQRLVVNTRSRSLVIDESGVLNHILSQSHQSEVGRVAQAVVAERDTKELFVAAITMSWPG